GAGQGGGPAPALEDDVGAAVGGVATPALLHRPPGGPVAVVDRVQAERPAASRPGGASAPSTSAAPWWRARRATRSPTTPAPVTSTWRPRTPSPSWSARGPAAAAGAGSGTCDARRAI